VQVANYNAPGQVVISGAPAGVTLAMELARTACGRPRPLAVSVAAHSALMAPAANEFGRHVAATPFRAPQIPIIGNIHARPLTTPDEIRAELVGQLTSSVRWTASVEAMTQAGATRFVEIGPGEVLTGLVKRIAPDADTANVRTPDDMTGV
jgi:[acyl-carrier-protein] S-malonyltransferase